LARLLLVLLLWVAAALLIAALVREQRRHRRRLVLARLTAAFQHGAPLTARRAPLEGRRVALGPARLSLPPSWTLESHAGRLEGFLTPSDDRRLVIACRPPDEPGAWGEDEVTPSGARLSRHLDLSQDGKRLLYAWRWRCADRADALGIVVHLDVALERAPDVLVAADIAAVDRALREAEPLSKEAEPQGASRDVERVGRV
jgi:hypothetical protein